MKRPTASRKQQQSQTDAPLISGILQRQAVKKVSEDEVQTPTSTRESGVERDFSQVPVSAGNMPIQAKLTVGAAGDKYEQEADQVAAAVVNHLHSSSSKSGTEQQSVQREDAEEEELQMKADSLQREEAEEEELQMKADSLQREEAEEEELQMKPTLQRMGQEGGLVSDDIEAEIQSARGGGQTLAPDLQAQMGQAMAADFSGVRVHTDDRADSLNRMVGARAFTTGQDVFFKQGEYQPGNRGGQELIAHELTHVKQQNGSSIQKTEDSNAPIVTINNTTQGAGLHLQRKSNGVAQVGPFYDLDGNGIYGADVPVNATQVSKLVRQIQIKSHQTSEPLNIKILTGTHGSSSGHLVGEAMFYNQDLSEEGNLANTGWVNVNNVITAGSKDTVTSWMEHGNRAVVLAWCYSSRSYSQWNTRHCWKTENDAKQGWDKKIW